MTVDIPEINFINHFTIEEIALLYAGINPFLPNINIPSLINNEASASLIKRGLIESLEAGEFKELNIRYIEQPAIEVIVNNKTEPKLVINNTESKFNGNSLIKISRKEIAKWFAKRQYEQPVFLHKTKELTEKSFSLEINSNETDIANDRFIYNKITVYLVNLLITYTNGNKYGAIRNPNFSQIRDSILEYAEKYRFNSKPEGLASSDKKIANSFEAIDTGKNHQSKILVTREINSSKRLIGILCRLIVNKQRKYGTEESPYWEEIELTFSQKLENIEFNPTELKQAISVLKSSFEFILEERETTESHLTDNP